MYSSWGGEGSRPRPSSWPSPPISCPVCTTSMSTTAACVPSPQPVHCGTLSSTAMLLAGGALLPQLVVCLGSLFAFCSHCHLLSTHLVQLGPGCPPATLSFHRALLILGLAQHVPVGWGWTGSTGPAACPCDSPTAPTLV